MTCCCNLIVDMVKLGVDERAGERIGSRFIRQANTSTGIVTLTRE